MIYACQLDRKSCLSTSLSRYKTRSILFYQSLSLNATSEIFTVRNNLHMYAIQRRNDRECGNLLKQLHQHKTSCGLTIKRQGFGLYHSAGSLNCQSCATHPKGISLIIKVMQSMQDLVECITDHTCSLANTRDRIFQQQQLPCSSYKSHFTVRAPSLGCSK